MAGERARERGCENEDKVGGSGNTSFPSTLPCRSFWQKQAIAIYLPKPRAGSMCLPSTVLSMEVIFLQETRAGKKIRRSGEMIAVRGGRVACWSLGLARNKSNLQRSLLREVSASSFTCSVVLFWSESWILRRDRGIQVVAQYAEPSAHGILLVHHRYFLSCHINCFHHQTRERMEHRKPR